MAPAGDSAITAAAIARECGILEQDSPSPSEGAASTSGENAFQRWRDVWHHCQGAVMLGTFLHSLGWAFRKPVAWWDMSIMTYNNELHLCACPRDSRGHLHPGHSEIL